MIDIRKLFPGHNVSEFGPNLTAKFWTTPGAPPPISNAIMPGISGNILWYRADLGVTSSGGNVYQWKNYDTQGPVLKNNLTQSNSSFRPLFNSSNAILNNKPTIDFDGVNDLLGTQSLDIPSNGGGATLVHVLAAPTTISNKNYSTVGTEIGSPWNSISLRTGLSSKYNLPINFGGSFFQQNSIGSIAAGLVIVSIDSGSNQRPSIYINGPDDLGAGTITVASSMLVSGDDIVLGDALYALYNSVANIPASVDIAEFAAYNRKLTNAEINEIASYVSTSYHISQSYL